jgi:hypothetical protein
MWEEVTTPHHHDYHQNQRSTVHHHHVEAAEERRNHQDHGVSMIVVYDNCYLCKAINRDSNFSVKGDTKIISGIEKKIFISYIRSIKLSPPLFVH